MPSTYQSIVVNAPIEAVWDTVKNFHDFSWAPAVIESCEVVGDATGLEVGAKRVLNGAFEETLVELDDEIHKVRYSIDNGPSPVSSSDVKNYFGTLRLRSSTIDNKTLVEWGSVWDSDSDEAVEFCHGIYVALLQSLAGYFEA
ncbi:MAG: Polyketide cyclase [uncultured Thiotrichaceae bacterium]|uniref:Polyketide cyclase n=1 Tax=uncultured Thiotrichaceae bacterium TaxID=298394 RepID=A0A6S6TYM3_9GAMM|nr:MAG: Polyketide cyclase [uncultured Thiotrichaceae bacterium]